MNEMNENQLNNNLEVLPEVQLPSPEKKPRQNTPFIFLIIVISLLFIFFLLGFFIFRQNKQISYLDSQLKTWQASTSLESTPPESFVLTSTPASIPTPAEATPSIISTANWSIADIASLKINLEKLLPEYRFTSTDLVDCDYIDEPCYKAFPVNNEYFVEIVSLNNSNVPAVNLIERSTGKTQSLVECNLGLYNNGIYQTDHPQIFAISEGGSAGCASYEHICYVDISEKRVIATRDTTSALPACGGENTDEITLILP